MNVDYDNPLFFWSMICEECKKRRAGDIGECPCGKEIREPRLVTRDGKFVPNLNPWAGQRLDKPYFGPSDSLGRKKPTRSRPQ